MSTIVYRISVLLGGILADVPVGTNLGLFWLLWALLSGRFLLSRGAVFPALADGGLPADAVRRSGAALAYGRWAIQPLVRAWQQIVQQEGRWHAHRYEGFRPVACDLVGFFRPHLSGCVGKHYQSGADKALPAIVLAVVAAVGSVGKVRLPLLRLVLRADPDDGSEAALQRRALMQAGAALQPDEVLVVDAGFGVADLLTGSVPRFVARVARNFTARRNVLPAYKGRGRRPTYGERVRPLPRKHKGKTHCRHACGCHRPVGGGRADSTRPSLGQSGPLHRQAGSCDVSVCGDPRPALPRTAGGGDEPAGISLCAVVSVPRPLADRAGTPGGQADARRAPGVCVWWREPPPPARVGAVGGQCLGVCGRHDSGDGHGLLGSALPSDVWALASGAAARGFFRGPRTGRRTAEKGVGDGAFAQGRAGASASAGRSNTPGQQPSTAESRLI